jgi:Na+-transporting NADH:ubiquinone oxidoreductase subunit NqrB
VSAQAAPAPGGLALSVRGATYPVVLPKLGDPRLHLAATITSLQVIGQVGFHFQLSIAQILISLATCAVLEVAIAARRQHILLWPASALLTGNGVAFVLRVPGTTHGDWWSVRGWWIFAGTAAVALLSKHVLVWRGAHLFNPSNIGLVICFLVLDRTRAAPLDFWWGPMSSWLVLALAVIVGGGFVILRRLQLLRVALGFWASFAAGIAVVAAAGHAMSARWHLGPVTGFHLWAVLVTSPEVLVFLFFMITDPKTAPRGARARLGYAVSLGLLAALLIAPTTTEFASKVALLGSLAVVCLAIPVLRMLPRRLVHPRLAFALPLALVLYTGTLVFATSSAPPRLRTTAIAARELPPIQIAASPSVQSQLDPATARIVATALVKSLPGTSTGRIRMWLEPGTDQGPPVAVARFGGTTYRLHQAAGGRWELGSDTRPRQVETAPQGPVATGYRLKDIASSVGLDFRQSSFRFGMSNDDKAMMGGGVCWIDYNGDGWLDLFAVNSYSSADTARFEAHGGLPRTALYENVFGKFRNVSRAAHADLAVQGDGCVAGDLNGDGKPDLVVTTTSGVELLWNNGHGRFAEGARRAGLDASGWYTGAAVADVNGDGRPDLFVAGYAEPNDPVPGSLAGFPTNLAGVRDLLYLNEGDDASGHATFREVGIQAGLEAAQPRHGLGAEFIDYNFDRRPDLYVANDEDPNQLYENVPWPGGARADPAGLGFRFEERGAAEGVADPFAGMGVAADNGVALNLFVTNSRHEPSAAFRVLEPGSTPAFAAVQASVDPALGSGFAGWGASFVDLTNSGNPALVLTAGAIPVTSLAHDAEPVRVLAPVGRRTTLQHYGDARGVLGSRGLRLNGRGLAAADAGNDGRMDVAINTIGGKLVLLSPQGPSGHWLDVKLARFSPGAVVTAELPDGRILTHEVRAGSSYLSSEDPRVHFGLGAATRVTRLIVRYAWGGESRLAGVRADRMVEVGSPSPPPVRTPASPAPIVAGCTRSGVQGRSVARLWDETAVLALREGGASTPVQARDLFDLSAAMWDAWAAYDPQARGYFFTEKASAADVQSAREAAISYAAYRLLVWRASFGSDLGRTFELLTAPLRSLCYTPDFTGTAGDSPAALGNRIAAAAIASGRRDGSLEALHYVDASYVPMNGPLVVSEAGSTVHDPTFWQPLALGRITPHGLASIPAKIQTFADAQWGRVRGFALPPSSKRLTFDPGPPPFGDPSTASYKQAAVDVIRATAGRRAPTSTDASPLAWNLIADSLPLRKSATHRLRQDVQLYVGLNGALNDAAVAVFGAKRRYQSPRPISTIRYLAFQGQSSDPQAPSYNADGLPLVPGLIELITKQSSASGERHAALHADIGQVAVLSQGRWVLGSRWTPPSATPDSPGWVSEQSAFASAAAEVLTAFTGRSFDRQAELLGRSGVAGGIETPADESAGSALGKKVGQRARAQALRYASR